MFVDQSKEVTAGTIDNRQIEIRLISRTEEPIWNKLMVQHLYLGYNGFVGERLKYVATYLVSERESITY